MSNPSTDAALGPSRRTLAPLALVALLALAGCGAVPGLGATDSASPLDSVPGDSTAVVHVDADGALDDGAVRAVLNGTVRTAAGPGRGPDSVGEALASAGRNTSLDPEGLRAVTFFAKPAAAGGTEYGAAVLDSEWSEADLVAALRERSDAPVPESSYAGYTTYGEGGDAFLLALGDGRYVAGSEAAVKEAADVAAGDAAPLNGDVRSAFERTEEGHLRYAAAAGEGLDPSAVPESGYDTRPFERLTVVSGSLSTVEGGDLSLTARMAFASEGAAADAGDVLEGAAAAYRDSGDPTAERVLSEEHLSIETDGSTVTVTATNEPGTYVALGRAYAALVDPAGVAGLGAGNASAAGAV
jgi:hypothetical protein